MDYFNFMSTTGTTRSIQTSASRQCEHLEFVPIKWYHTSYSRQQFPVTDSLPPFEKWENVEYPYKFAAIWCNSGHTKDTFLALHHTLIIATWQNCILFSRLTFSLVSHGGLTHKSHQTMSYWHPHTAQYKSNILEHGVKHQWNEWIHTYIDDNWHQEYLTVLLMLLYILYLIF